MKNLLIIICAVAMFAACNGIPEVPEPVAPTLTKDPALVGVWVGDKQTKDTVTFTDVKFTINLYNNSMPDTKYRYIFITGYGTCCNGEIHHVNIINGQDDGRHLYVITGKSMKLTQCYQNLGPEQNKPYFNLTPVMYHKIK